MNLLSCHFLSKLIVACLLSSFSLFSFALISNNSCSSGKAKSSGCVGGNEVGGDAKNDASCCSKAIAAPRDVLKDVKATSSTVNEATKTAPNGATKVAASNADQQSASSTNIIMNGPDGKPSRYWTKAASCGGSSRNCTSAEAIAGTPPAGGGWLCCAYRVEQKDYLSTK